MSDYLERILAALLASPELTALVPADYITSEEFGDTSEMPDCKAVFVHSLPGPAHKDVNIAWPGVQIAHYAATPAEARRVVRAVYDVLSQLELEPGNTLTLELTPFYLKDPSRGWPRYIAHYKATTTL